MRIREIAYSIFEQLTEEELALFRRAYPPKIEDRDTHTKAFARLEQMCRLMPDLDEKRELAEYREEKYGK